MRVSSIGIALLGIIFSLDAMTPNKKPRGKARQSLRNSCKLEAETFQIEEPHLADDVSSHDESPRDEIDQRHLMTSAGFMHIKDNDEVRHSVNSHTYTPESSDNEDSYDSEVDDTTTEKMYWCFVCNDAHYLPKYNRYDRKCVSVWCEKCELYKNGICWYHNLSSSSASSDEYEYDEYDVTWCYATETDIGNISLESHIELSELDKKARSIRKKKKKLIYKKRAYAIKKQRAHGISHKHIPRIVAFKRVNNLKKMLS